MNLKKLKNQFRKCERCVHYYKKTCRFDGNFPKWWYKVKKCKYEEKLGMRKNIVDNSKEIM